MEQQVRPDVVAFAKVVDGLFDKYQQNFSKYEENFARLCDDCISPLGLALIQEDLQNNLRKMLEKIQGNTSNKYEEVQEMLIKLCILCTKLPPVY